MTATPIPRTLQRAMVGLQSLSILANPPARRLPIRTVVTPFEPSILREALLYERRRGGQSFVVCPRIEDIEPLRDQLTEIIPELQLKVAHGKLPAQIIDDVMVSFANARGDVLLTTNIIESGLDLPRANTILIWRPDRFGAAQLHQLRGRVGRGRRRGLAYLLTDPRSQLAPATTKRLQMIAELDRLGAGFTISQRDMDLRGAGDILGEKQAGHIRLVGAELYRHLLERAIAGLNGGSAEPEWRPELNLGVTGLIPSDYIADPEIRINLYARAARIRELRDIDRFADEIEDRFGQLPPATQNLLQLAKIRETARRLGAVRLDAGPRAIALTLQADRVEPMRRALGCTKEFYWKEDRLVHERTNYDDEPLRATLTLLDRLGSP